MENEETARKLCDAFFFPFLPHKLNTLDFNLLIAYARAHTNVLCIVLGFYFFNFFFQFFNFSYVGNGCITASVIFLFFIHLVSC